jgi:hypothetical protein
MEAELLPTNRVQDLFDEAQKLTRLFAKTRRTTSINENSQCSAAKPPNTPNHQTKTPEN